MKKRFKIPLYFFSFLFFVCLVIWGLVTQTKLLENQVNRLLRVFVQSRYSLKVNVGDISGSFWRELIIKDLTVDFAQEGTGYRIASIPYLKVNYKLSNLWRKEWIADSIIVDHPKFALQKTVDGKLLLASSPKTKVLSKTGLFDFKVGSLKINHGVFEYLDGVKLSTVDSLNLELSLSKEKEEVKANISRGGFAYLQKDFLVNQFEGFFRLKKDSLLVQGLKVKTPDSDLEISGELNNLRKPQFSFSIKGSPVNLVEIKKLTGVELEGVLDVEGTCQGNLKKFEGEATMDGQFLERGFEKVKTVYSYQDTKLTFSSIRGNVFGSLLSGKGELNLGKKPEEYEFEGKVSHLDLNKIIFGSLHTDFSGDISLIGRSFSEKDVVMEAEVNLQNVKIEQYRFNAAKGVMDITTTGVVFHPQFQVDYKNTKVILSGELQYEGEVDIDATVSLGDLRDFWNQIFIKEMMGRGKANVKISGKTSDFDIKGEFLSDSCYVYQLYSTEAKVDLNLANFITRPKGEADILFLHGNAYGLDYDTLISKMKIDSLWIDIDTTRLLSRYFDLNLWGELDASVTPQTLLIHQMVLDYRENRLQTLSPTVVEIDTQKIEIKKLVLSGTTGEIDLAGNVDYEERMNLSVKLSELIITPWAALFTLEPIEGMLSAQAQLQGNFQNPQIELQGDIKRLKFKGMDFGDLETDLSYKEKKLEVKNLGVKGIDWEYDLAGFLPMDLSFYSVKQRILEQPQSFRLHVKGRRLELIRWFIPDIEYLTGDFDGNWIISGSLFHPQFDGKMTLTDASLKFAQLADPVERLSVEMRMKNENLILDKVSGFIERGESDGGGPLKKIWRVFFKKRKLKGEVSGFGTINLQDINNIDYDLYFSGVKVPINYEYADLSAIADASVQITGKSPPLVSAQIILPELFYREPFTSSGSETSISPTYPEEGLWDWNLDISIPNNCWIINNDVNLELSGEVRVLREKGVLNILGDLETIRGKYFLYGTKFNIEKGSFVFDNIQKIDPKIDFLVSTTMRGGTSGLSGGSNLLSTGTTNEIELTIKGTISEPEVQPPSGYSQEDIIELLALQRSVSSVDSAGVGSLFQERVVKSLGGAYSSRLLENVAGQTLGVETFEIVPAWNEKLRLTDAQITIGKYVSNKIYLRYTRSLSQSSGQETGVEYRLSKNLLLEGHKDKLGLFHFGLNLNWEY
jgi:autotransporter translocation and assembly factor TamB